MKTPVVIAIVVAVHVVAVGSLVLIQGCGTTPKQETVVTPPQPVMPPLPEQPVVKPVPVKPVIRPVVPAEAAPETLATKSYVVKQGDSLSLIAHRFHLTVKEIVALNKLSSPDKIRVGQKLVLPGYVDLSASAAAPVSKAKPKAAAASAAASGKEYVVVSGDTLSAIAVKCGTTTKALRAVNKLSSDNLRVGQKLALPTASIKPAAAEKAAPAAPAAVAPAPAMPSENMAPPAAPVAGQAPAKAETPSFVHVVEPGQQLRDIAMLYAVSVDSLMKLNSLTNETLAAGQTLKVPPSE